MFTGIIQSVGAISESTKTGSDRRLGVNTGKLEMANVNPGDSIAVNGVCLTAIEIESDKFFADVSTETLQRTSLGLLRVGAAVNLEKALTLATPLGGHLVSGHVDGLGTVLSRQDSGRFTVFSIQAPDELAKYIAVKGSICVDGISLTVNAVNGNEFELTIVPHTLKETIMNAYQPGKRVNLEVDIIARYLERLHQGDDAAKPASELKDATISVALLKKHGFID